MSGMNPMGLDAAMQGMMAGVNATNARKGQKNLGQMITLLEARLLHTEKPDQRVRFDFGDFMPDGLESYRGYYEHLALGFRDSVYPTDYDNPLTLAELLKMLQTAVGKVYEGYKGGDYTMTEKTPLWVSNIGESDSVGVIGLADSDHDTVIATCYLD